MASTKARFLAITGLVLQLGLPVGMLIALLGLFTPLGSLAGESTQAAQAINESLRSSIRVLLLGQNLALVGLILFSIAVIAGRYRARWVFNCGRLAMIPWLLAVPVGTVVGIIGLIYFSGRRAEFTPQPSPTKKPIPSAP